MSRLRRNHRRRHHKTPLIHREDKTINNQAFYTALALDATALLIVGGCVYSASRKGFLRMALQIILYIAVFLFASNISERSAPMIYERYVAPIISEQKQEIENAVLAQAQPTTFMENIGVSLGILPREIDLEYWINYAQDQMEDVKDQMIDEFMENTIRPIAIAAIRSLCFAVVFFVLVGIGNALLRIMGFVRDIPVIGGVNAFFGAVLGMGQGLLIVWLLGILLHGLLILGQGEWWVFAPEIVDSSYIFRYFYDPTLLMKQ